MSLCAVSGQLGQDPWAGMGGTLEPCPKTHNHTSGSIALSRIDGTEEIPVAWLNLQLSCDSKDMPLEDALLCLLEADMVELCLSLVTILRKARRLLLSEERLEASVGSADTGRLSGPVLTDITGVGFSSGTRIVGALSRLISVCSQIMLLVSDRLESVFAN